MKILYLIPTYKPSKLYGGVTEVASHMAESMANIGHDVTVYTTNGNGKENLKIETGKELLRDNVKVFYFNRITGDHSHLSPDLWLKIFSTVKDFDIVHIHSWWSISIIIAAGICKLRGVRPVLSPHGMFCDYVLHGNNRLKKKLLHYFSRSFLTNSFLHVSTKSEWEESQKFLGREWKGSIIPNPVKLNSSIPVERKFDSDIFEIGFLSRIDPKKGLDVLIRSLSKVNFRYNLRIAGGGDPDYLKFLDSLSVKCGNAENITWVGWKFNEEKFAFLSTLDLFALTSLNENFAVVVIESLSVGTPVILSNHVGLASYVEDNHFGWVTGIDDEAKVAMQLDYIYGQFRERQMIRSIAPRIISRDYSTNSIIRQYEEFYKKLIFKESKRKTTFAVENSCLTSNPNFKRT